jgi:ATP-dependent Clp protease ATP-binding subunit ClpB
MAQLLTRQPVLEPSLGDAAEMVRGSAGIYERHHGIQIGEEAIVMAVSLAKRYVPDRFLPDSAFDLLDEASASKRVDADGVPPELDVPLRRLESLRAQLQALEGAGDDATLRARRSLEDEAARLAPEVESMRERFERRRSARALLAALRAQLAEVGARRDEARARDDLAQMGELEHVTLVDLRRRLERAEAAAREAGV